MIDELLIDPERHVLTLRLPDGQRLELHDEALRAACKCAFCESDRRKGLPPVVVPGTHIVGWEPKGMGIHLRFSDGHAKGIYPYAYLIELADTASAP